MPLSTEAQEQLWSEYSKLCRYFANKNRWILQADHAIDYDDLVQTAFLGLVKAAESYKSDTGKSFAAWVGWAITGEFRRLLGWYNSDTPPAHVYAPSLDVPAYGDEDADESKLDLVEDTTLRAPETALEAADLSGAVTGAINRLKGEKRRTAVSMHYLQNKPYSEVGAALGVNHQRARTLALEGVWKMRKDEQLCREVALYDFLPSYSTGFTAFTQNGSQTERAALWLIEHERGAS